MQVDPQRRSVSDDDVQPIPLPLNPATPITNPRQMAQDTDPFVSPAGHSKVMKHSFQCSLIFLEYEYITAPFNTIWTLNFNPN